MLERQSHPFSAQSVVWTPSPHFYAPQAAGPKLEAFVDDHARRNTQELGRRSGHTQVKRPFLVSRGRAARSRGRKSRVSIAWQARIEHCPASS